jgi:hypothetical protein
MGALFEAVDTKRLNFVHALAKPFHGKLMSIAANAPILGKLHFHYAPRLYQEKTYIVTDARNDH